MESENGAESGPPVRFVTVNQIVAWNIAWLRRAADMTQEDLGELLGWPQNKVSEAERSWNGKRTREFDAQTIAALAMALGVPVTAFFLPPLDDRKDAVYLIRPPGQDGDRTMADLLALTLPDNEDETEVMNSYRRRLINTVGEYLGADWMKEVARWLVRLLGLEALREGAYRLRALRAALLTEAALTGTWADAIEEAIGKEEDE